MITRGGISRKHARTGRLQKERSRPAIKRSFLIGAEVIGEHGASFRVWAPNTSRLQIQVCEDGLWDSEKIHYLVMKRESNGYYSIFLPYAKPGMLYKFKFDGDSYPDPASRFQPLGPHGPSQLIDPTAFSWTDHSWPGVARHNQILYEMHIGTFTREGT